MSSLNCLFVVQGEGRGHLTQALALRKILEAAGHRVPSVLLGRNPNREAPRFFLDKIGAPVERIDSPSFFMDGHRRAMASLGATIWKNVPLIGRFREGLRTVDRAMKRHRPDVVINFHEVLAGVHYALHRPAVPLVCVAHQYMFQHPAYPSFPAGRRWDRGWLRFFVGATSLGATKRLALSLYRAPHRRDEGLVVMPPLLRKALADPPASPDREEPFFLMYLLNSGYAEEVVRWHRRHPGVRLHCFWDRPGASAVERYDDTLTFHALDDEKFLAMMKRCRGLATTAGFESVGEALYLGKPVLMVPVEGHFEQHCNALDGQHAGAGVAAAAFDPGLSRLAAFAERPRNAPPRATARFRQWLAGADARFVREIEEAAGVERPVVSAGPAASDGASEETALQAT